MQYLLFLAALLVAAFAVMIRNRHKKVYDKLLAKFDEDTANALCRAIWFWFCVIGAGIMLFSFENMVTLDYIVASVVLVFGIFMVFFQYKRTLKKMEEYKKAEEQKKLEEANKAEEDPKEE